MEDGDSGGDIHSDSGTDRTGNGFMHCMKSGDCKNDESEPLRSALML